ncbi:MAG: ABC transporter substrate-binding protein, partial [Thermomicrobiales bacterium]|nr:ABC transporter substrate-binding protein [Thermomicrobiales bacterium]
TRARTGAGDGTDADIPLPAARVGQGHRRWVLLLLGVLLLVVAAAISLMQKDAPTPSDYVIAFAGPLTGPDGAIGQEQLRAIELAVAEQNAQGGIGGHRLRVVSFDDGNDPERARQVAETIAADDSVVLVIGHKSSSTTIAAAPVYEQAGLAVISSSATADVLTEGEPWVFRSIFTNQVEGAFAAAYARHALGAETASTIATPGQYESSLASAFAQQMADSGDVQHEWVIDPADRDASIARIIADLREQPEPDMVFLALQSDDAHALLLALGRAGLHPTMLGGEALGFNAFGQWFAQEPEELDQPGFFTNGLYTISPLIYDSLGGKALNFSEQFRTTYAVAPGWYGAKAFDAATFALYALSSLDGDSVVDHPVAEVRGQVQAALARLVGGDESVSGLEGPIYFDENRAVSQAISVGIFDLGVLQSAPLQYRPVTEWTDTDQAAEEAAGLAFTLNGELYRQYRVVYVGLDLNEVSGIDVRDQTFNADFFLWFRYLGDASAENIFFTNADDPDLALPDPIDRSEIDDQHFVMYRVDATFNQPMDFRNYPWDKHTLAVGLQNVTLSENDIVYVPDRSNLRQTQAERLDSGVDVQRPFNRVPNWIATRVLYAQDSAITRSTTPDSRTGAPELRTASTYEVQMFFERDVRAFLIKNLLPLALLALVTYISLYFSPENASTRIGFSITSILTSSVMLQSISSNLPDVGYTVAIEWVYYVYIALSALLVLVNITLDRWYKARRYAAVAQLDRIARVAYPLVILLVVSAYAWRFG